MGKVKYKLSEKLMLKKIGDKYVFLPKDEFEIKKLYFTNEIGYQILGFLMKGMPIEKIVNELLLYYEVEKSVLENDVKGFISYLLEKKVIYERK